MTNWRPDPEWLTVDALERLERSKDAEALKDELQAQQPEWSHALIIGKGGMAAVISEVVV